ncbi:hypothetical protein B0H63DRAFT_110361 [Podospora didyma]|uniref:Fungal N-terminal domain-containing protein n=1 Tax=Podospora didyma TaxID=330526 RepID=A0AAE0NZ58_9PEZI|nr:hypothetical protein B0H63DRAFT_110361 [Podospora didyma]
MSFGFGISDLIAGANLAHQLIRVMTETRGASDEYHEAMKELCAIQQAFIHVSQVIRSNVLPQATLNAAAHIVMSSMDIIEKFLARTRFYQKQLQCSGISGSRCKAGWALFKKNELRSLGDSLHCSLVAMNTLFAAAQYTHTLPDSIAQFQVFDDESSKSPRDSVADSAVAMSNTDIISESPHTSTIHSIELNSLVVLGSKSRSSGLPPTSIEDRSYLSPEAIEGIIQKQHELARATWEADNSTAAHERKTTYEKPARPKPEIERRSELERDEACQEADKNEYEYAFLKLKAKFDAKRNLKKVPRRRNSKKLPGRRLSSSFKTQLEEIIVFLSSYARLGKGWKSLLKWHFYTTMSLDRWFERPATT